MSTPASIARHPIHPMLVAFPIGLWVFSVVADLIYHLGWGRAVWTDVAFYSIGAGIVGALLAAVPGFIDFFSITVARVRTIALYHMSANLIAVVIFGVSFWLRWTGVVSVLPVAVSIIGLAVIAFGGWLGGELVYVHRMGVEEPPGAVRREPSSRRHVA